MPDVSSSTSSDRRAQQVCAFGLIVQVCVLACVVGMGAWWLKSDAIAAEGLHMAAAVLIWLVLLITYTQRKRAKIETFETEELRRAAEAGTSTAIFEAADETLHLERHRLRWIYRWFLPASTVVLAIFHIGTYVGWQLGFALPLSDSRWSTATNSSLAATIVAFAMFFCFLCARYAAGLARQPEWQMLRAAATYLVGNALACLLLVVALLIEGKVPYAEPLVVYVVRIMMLILGIEFAINFILDIYRPRAPDEEPRPGFDSRLLALISEPGGVARSIAEAINYQFGFEVSGTWFYKLLQRSFLPLIAFMLLALEALTCVVIIDADQQAIVERWGKPVSAELLSPGIHVQWPWPADRVWRDSVSRLRSVLVGSYSADDEKPEEPAATDGLILWTEKHEFSPHMMVLVATPEETDLSVGNAVDDDSRDPMSRSRAVGVSMLMCSVAIEYRVSNLTDYLYNYQDPRSVMEAIAYQTLTDYAASVDIATVTGPGREEFEDGLRQQIEQRIAGLNPSLGIDIAFLGLQGAHPPSEEGVAKAFQDVVSAEKRKETVIEDARGRAMLAKTTAAGSVERADLLDAAIIEADRLANDPSATEEQRAQARMRVEELMMGSVVKGISPMSGQAAAGIAEAKALRAALLSGADSKVRVFANELAAYQAAPQLYRVRKYLDVLTRSVEHIRKFVIVADRATTNLVIIFETEKPSLLDLSEPPTGKKGK